MKNGGGHFAPELGGHFELESGGHFKLELGGQYDWNLQLKRQDHQHCCMQRVLNLINILLEFFLKQTHR